MTGFPKKRSLWNSLTATHFRGLREVGKEMPIIGIAVAAAMVMLPIQTELLRLVGHTYGQDCEGEYRFSLNSKTTAAATAVVTFWSFTMPSSLDLSSATERQHSKTR